MKKFLPAAILFTFFSSCYISKKLEVPATIKINYNFTVSLNPCEGPKYISNHSSSSYKDYFLEAFRNELKKNNLTLKDSGTVDYTLEISLLKITEDISTETVSNESSAQNGEKFELHGCGVYLSGILNKKNGEKIDEIKADASKNEELTNRRTFFEWVFGVNKDHTSYHIKTLFSGVCQDLSAKCGKRTCAVITKKIVKAK